MKRDHAKLICDVGELSDIFHDTSSMEAFLQKIVELIAEHMSADVCSIYLYYEEHDELVLKATKGLKPSSVNNVKMKLGEGLTGKALKELRPICEAQARNNPNFRFFPGIGEERYESFLAVPMVRGNIRIGAIVVQSEKCNYFTKDDIYVFRAITSQLVNTVETAKLLMSFNEAKKAASSPLPVLDIKLVKGRVGSEGVSFSPAIVVTENLTELTRYLSLAYKGFTLDDFHRAVEMAEEQLADLQNQVEAMMYDVASLIFTSQILMLKDQSFINGIVSLIEKGETPVHAIVQVVEGYVKKFGLINDAYLREKIHDVKDVGRRILENLAGESDTHYDYAEKVVIAHELLPSDALELYSQRVKGIIVLSGGVTSHLSILARSLGIPLVIADEPRLMILEAGTPVLLDAVMGNIHVNPHKAVVENVFGREDLNKNMESLKTLVKSEPKTKDSVAVNLFANINLLGDVKAACEFNAKGVGLYRTEFPFIMRSNFPSEEEQYQIYRRLLEGMGGKEVTFRTLDIGGDKVLSYYNNGREENPFLGLRSIRFSLRHQDIFEQQIRAILRAGVGHTISIMFPMISSVDEFRQAKGIVAECSRKLKKEKKDCHPGPKVGIMIELPSVLEIIDELSQEVCFLSVGTNDLIQYLLAVDRTNEKVADMYVPHHPSVLRALNKIVSAAERFKKNVSICGDMAHHAKYLEFFIGIGVRNFSVDPRYLPRMHQQIGEISQKACTAFAQNLLSKVTVLETSKLINSSL